MVNNPEDYQDHLTLEAVEHNPDVSPLSQSDAKFANNPGYSTLESTPWQPNNNEKMAASPPAAVREEYSTLEAQTPSYDHREVEKGTTDIGAAGDSDTPKENWKRRKVCGIPLLFLLIGALVVVAVIAAVVGGVVGSRSMDSGKQVAGQQNSNEGGRSSPPGNTLQSTGSSPIMTVDVNGKFISPSSTSSSPTATQNAAVWADVEIPANRYHKLGMGYDSAATYYYLGYNGSTSNFEVDAVNAEPDTQAQGRNTGIADNKKWQFENAKEVSDYDTISTYIRDFNGGMVYYLHNKKDAGTNHVLGIDYDEYFDGSGKFIGTGTSFPVEFVSLDHQSESQMWYLKAGNSSRYGMKPRWRIRNMKLGSWHLSDNLMKEDTDDDKLWDIEEAQEDAPDQSSNWV